MISLFTLTCNAQTKKIPLQKVIINDVDWPPYFFLEGSNLHLGIGKEIINTCLAKNNYLAEYVPLPIKRTHIYMQNGDIDITVYSYKPEREAFLFFAKEPLFDTEYGFMTRSDSNYIINGLDDLGDLRIGHLAGLSYTPELLKIIEEKLANNDAVVANSMKAVFSQLLAQTPRIDITASAKSTFYWQANLLGVQDKIKVLDYTIKSKQYFITVSKKSSNIAEPMRFLQKMDQCVAEMKSNGEYQTLLSRYINIEFAN